MACGVVLASEPRDLSPTHPPMLKTLYAILLLAIAPDVVHGLHELWDQMIEAGITHAANLDLHSLPSYR